MGQGNCSDVCRHFGGSLARRNALVATAFACGYPLNQDKYWHTHAKMRSYYRRSIPQHAWTPIIFIAKSLTLEMQRRISARLSHLRLSSRALSYLLGIKKRIRSKSKQQTINSNSFSQNNITSSFDLVCI